MASGRGGPAVLSPTSSDAAAVTVTGGDASAETGTGPAVVLLLLTPLEAAEVGASGGDALEETGIEVSEEERCEEGEEKNGSAEGVGLKRRNREDRTMKRMTATTIGRLRSERKERAEEIAIPPVAWESGTGVGGAGRGKGENSRRRGSGCGGRGRRRARAAVWAVLGAGLALGRFVSSANQ